MHKKSVTSVYFMDNINLAVSCDSTIHIWDPFVGTGVHQVISPFILTKKLFLVGLRGLQSISNPVERPCMYNNISSVVEF